MTSRWIEFAMRLQAVAQAGLHYSHDRFERERFDEIRAISVEMMAQYSETEIETVRALFAAENGYQTPKVDVRGVVFDAGRILLVQEDSDGCWSLPGGWADIGYSPAENVMKEVREEAGLQVVPRRLLALLDKKKHGHPPAPYHIYKLFIQCDWVGGELCSGLETRDARFFERDALPELSLRRITPEQMELLFMFYDNPEKETVIE